MDWIMGKKLHYHNRVLLESPMSIFLWRSREHALDNAVSRAVANLMILATKQTNSSLDTNDLRLCTHQWNVSRIFKEKSLVLWNTGWKLIHWIWCLLVNSWERGSWKFNKGRQILAIFLRRNTPKFGAMI